MGQAPDGSAQSGYRLTSDADAAGQFHCEIYPDQGGRIGSFWLATADDRRIDALIPMDGAVFDPLFWPKAGSYPLVPWSNLIRNAAFRHGDHQVHLQAHPQVAPHALHGFTQMRVWQVEEHSEQRLVMVYHHNPAEAACRDDGWPWAFEVLQTVTLDRAGLHVALAITNLSQETMPAGLGFHPYFKLAPGDHVRMTCNSQWQSTGDGFVSHKVTLTPQQADFDIRHAPLTMTLHYSDYARQMDIVRADGMAIRMTSSSNMRDLVYHVPPDGTYACIEPVTHVVDAVNLHSQGVSETGFIQLIPRETLTGTITITLNPG